MDGRGGLQRGALIAIGIALAISGCSPLPMARLGAQPTTGASPAGAALPISRRAAPTPSPRPRASAPARLLVVPADPAGAVPIGYVAYLPAVDGTLPATPPPLLVFLHGSGSGGPGTAASLGALIRGAIGRLITGGAWPSNRPFVVLMPQHAETDAAPCFTASEIDTFLAFALRTYQVDPARVYLTGLSCGAIGAWNYLAAHTDERVAAAVLISGDGRAAFAAAGCSLGLVPIWAFHGSADTVVDPAGSVETVGDLDGCTAPRPTDLRLTLYPGVGHDAWDRTYDLSAGNDIYAWLLQHHLGERSPS